MVLQKIELDKSVSGKEVYEALSGLQAFFEAIKQDSVNSISINRQYFISSINGYRLHFLQKMVYEEQIYQVLRSIEDPEEQNEFNGPLENYKQLLQHPSVTIMDGAYVEKADFTNRDCRKHL